MLEVGDDMVDMFVDFNIYFSNRKLFMAMFPTTKFILLRRRCQRDKNHSNTVIRYLFHRTGIEKSYLVACKEIQWGKK